MFETANYPRIGILIVAWLAADLLTPILILIAHKIGAVDRPHSYKIHKEPIPFLGGIAIYLAFSIAIFSTLRFSSIHENQQLFAMIGGSFFVVILGCLDDFRPISAVIKLILLMAMTFLLAQFDISIRMTGNDYIDFTLTLFWIAGVSSAMNSLDNMDGASVGISAIAVFFTFYVAWYSESVQMGLSYFCLSLFGACLGFLRYNFKPARIFLGDNGSLLLGFLLAAMTVLAGWSKEDRLKAFIIPCAIMVVPLYDITLSTFLRYKNGVVKSIHGAIVYCGKDHLSHRLVAMGLSQREAVMVMYLFGILGGGIAIFIARSEIHRGIYIPVTVAALTILIGVGVILDRAKVYPELNHEQKDNPS